MNMKRFLGAAVALFLFIFFFEWLVHGVLLMDTYQETAHLWRPFPEMEANMLGMTLFQILFAVWTAFAFTQIYKEGGIANGLTFGLYFGVFAALISGSWYLILPIPAHLAVSWFFSSLFELVVGGFILGSIYKK